MNWQFSSKDAIVVLLRTMGIFCSKKVQFLSMTPFNLLLVNSLVKLETLLEIEEEGEQIQKINKYRGFPAIQIWRVLVCIIIWKSQSNSSLISRESKHHTDMTMTWLLLLHKFRISLFFTQKNLTVLFTTLSKFLIKK